MSFTYDINLADSVSQVRSLIQDTIAEIADFQDEEITYFLTVNNNSVVDAAKECAFRLYVQYSKLSTVAEVDDVRIEYRDKAEQFKELYDEFKRRSVIAKSEGKTPMYFGGIDKSDFNNTRLNDSNMKPEFTKGNIFYNRDFPENDIIE